MLQWNSLHPYNAVHVVRIRREPDLRLLESAIRQTLKANSIARLTLSADRKSCSFDADDSGVEIKHLGHAADHHALLAAEIQRLLNTQLLQDAPFCPFRFFVGTGDHFFSLGIAYLHAIADAESIVLLLKEIVAACAPGHRQPLALRPACSPNLFWSHSGAFLRKLAAFPSLVRNMQHSHRPRYRDPEDLDVKFRLVALESPDLLLLVASAKRSGITVNDLLLALLLKSCATLAAKRDLAARRSRISVGCIVNTRRDQPGDLSNAFGLFLGSFIITHPVPPQITVSELARQVGQQTAGIKKYRLYLATPLELAFGQGMMALYSADRRRKLYQKHYPLWGGLTNMNINALWPMPVADGPCDYIRAVSTGPVTPLVLSFTTAGQGAHIGISSRSTVFSEPDLDHLINSFRDDLRLL